jgi:CHASE2 domain-containing sensor protein
MIHKSAVATYATHETALAEVKTIKGEVRGVAFAVGSQRLLTCAHVVNAALGRRQEQPDCPQDEVILAFPFLPEAPQVRARVINWYPPSENRTVATEDIAVLELLDHVPGLKSVEFANYRDHVAYRSFTTFGYPEERPREKGVWVDGKILETVSVGWVQIEGIYGQGRRVERGFSGTPVWSASGQYVLGMVVAEYSRDRSAKVAYMLPAGTLQQFIQTPRDYRATVPSWKLFTPKILVQRLIQPSTLKFSFSTILSTLLVLGIRSFGLLESIELSAYDYFMANRLQTEEIDDRLLIVGITEADLKAYKENQPLSDGIILKLLQKLKDYQPRIVGLDIVRDQALGNQAQGQHQRLVNFLDKHQSSIVTSCKIADQQNPEADPKYKLPQGINPENAGFINFSLDQGEVVRRHLLGLGTDETCKSDHSLSLRLATKYFSSQQIETIETGDIILSDKKIEIIDANPGPYQSSVGKERLRGYQVMLNYRAADQVARQVSMMDILNGKVNSEWIKDKLVLIGYTAESAGDKFSTPYSNRDSMQQNMYGVVIHAHMVSQLLSAVENNRSLIRLLPNWAEILYLGFWAGLGSLMGRRRIRYRVIMSIFIFSGLGLFTYGAFCYAVWLPLLPTFMTFVSGVCCIFGYSSIKKDTQNNN